MLGAHSYTSCFHSVLVLEKGISHNPQHLSCSTSSMVAVPRKRDWCCVEVPASAVRRRGRQGGENGLEFFAVGLDDFWSSLRFDAGLLRNISTELYHVLIMLTRGRAQWLVLMAAEPKGLEAYRLLLRRHEPDSTVTTVSEFADLLANHVQWLSHGFLDRFSDTSHVLGA